MRAKDIALRHRSRPRPPLGPLAGAVAAFIFLAPAQNFCLGQDRTSELLTTNAAIVLYLQNPPWIKDIRYVESQFQVIGDNGKIKTQFWVEITNHAAIQPSGYFVAELTTPKYSADVKPILGESDRYYWTSESNAMIGGALILSPRRPAEGGSEKNSPQIVGERRQTGLQRVRFLGLWPLLTNSFKLSFSNQFEAQTADGFALAGTFMAVVGNRPLALRYTVGGNTDEVYQVTYGYRAGEQIPVSFESSTVRRGHRLGGGHTNRIESVVYGEDEAITNGYVPGMFYGNVETFSITIWSNAQRYTVGRQGQREPVLAGITKFPDPGRPGFMPLVLGLIFLLGSGLFIWRYRVAHKE